ncbi:hypothetical protein cyc_08798 [Cyclospora cayetanensis]|uniref:Uncharacterized protein n=1 Tax=Cyclospora cayetanensis TaxID=88456 RepID=A0A1D3DB36_9EIME|nr:hypothetical protein cyc_08798 [Cyclospora cayetanensis]
MSSLARGRVPAASATAALVACLHPTLLHLSCLSALLVPSQLAVEKEPEAFPGGAGRKGIAGCCMPFWRAAFAPEAFTPSPDYRFTPSWREGGKRASLGYKQPSICVALALFAQIPITEDNPINEKLRLTALRRGVRDWGIDCNSK